ncbi:flagellar basal-body rod protein FlgC [Sporobacter termitidis DSM 10068]|uniref:Flagellar basal-body rod protein FlgC n=1 Tax=Sporobacter termitidis DSM 10068 TaxID=1123282 RepID=A0A1M5W7T2_9FIRM|nr:flagellar basal body rod protein FlgC [Sporobacter termitidis]SHH83537.1 flagellar basal-body rod protein FlgC [Sporobacter termitidis DSM 10068]
MGFLSGMNISGSGLTAQRLRMDVISENIANIDTTRAANGLPYTRKVTILEERNPNFSDVLKNSEHDSTEGGVRVAEISNDPSPYQLVYDPTNPDANADGYVQMPNVDITQEMVDMISAYRSYEANVTAFNAYKDMAVKALEIGK